MMITISLTTPLYKAQKAFLNKRVSTLYISVVQISTTTQPQKDSIFSYSVFSMETTTTGAT